jgi:prepilin-type N-terminal cleavage/methylation domain-containing protein
VKDGVCKINFSPSGGTVKRKGFTLIELMIVVVIIGILAALAIPRFLEASKKAKITEAKGICKQLYNLHQAFYQESGHFLANTHQLTKPVSTTDFTAMWFDAASQAMAESIAFNLPSGKPRFNYGVYNTGAVTATTSTMDASLSGVRIDIDPQGVMTTTVP